MQIVRRYFDEANWEPVDDETVRKVFARNFTDVELALVDIAAGYVLLTPGAEYRRVERTCQQEEPAA